MTNRTLPRVVSQALLVIGLSVLVGVAHAASTDGVALPPALAGSGHFLFLYNNTSQNCVVYPTVANNAVTGIQDTINSSTSFALNAHVAGIFFCGENGISTRHLLSRFR